MPGELGAILCTHPASSALDFGSSMAAFPPGRPIRCGLDATGPRTPSPPHPIPKHPSEGLTVAPLPLRGLTQSATRRTAHPRSREAPLDSPPSSGSPRPRDTPQSPVSPRLPARCSCTSPGPGREVPSSGRAPGPVPLYLARAAAGGGRPIRPVPTAPRSLHS